LTKYLFKNFYNDITALPIPYDTSGILGKKYFETEIFKALRRFVRRYFNVFTKGQFKLEQAQILPEHKKILWVFPSIAQIGDALMDLSSRILLKDKTIDLFSCLTQELIRQ